MNLKTAHCDISPTLSLYFINVTVWWRWSLLRWPAVTLTSWQLHRGWKIICLFVRWFSLLFPAASPPTGSRQQRVHDEETRLQQREALRSESDKHPAETCFQHVVENKLQLKSFSSFVLWENNNHIYRNVILLLNWVLSCVSVNKQKR